MYEELLIGLRGHAKRLGCDDRCPCYDAENRGYATCSEELAEKAADAIEELQQKWIPVTERLPKPMKYVLLVIRRMGKEFRHDPFISTGYMSINKVDWWCSHDGSCSANHVEVTHWMPLPEPPKEET